MKFEYAPGLPGYGTRGVDGSSGLTGLAMYFSSYDGISDSITIKSKIVSNKILFSTDELLPGYPNRIYQTGDQFIDKNGRVFRIDLNETNLYTNTSSQLNTSGFFESGPTTVQTPQYQRYSNAFNVSKFLIDIVYENTGAVGNYASNPGSGDTSIYGIRAVDFAQVKYVNNPVGDYHPYTVWTNTTSTTENDQAIALVKVDGSTNWRLGNAVTNGSIRSGINLFLDFDKVYGNFSGTISATNLYLPGWLRVDGDTSIGGNLIVDDIGGGNGNIFMYGTNFGMQNTSGINQFASYTDLNLVSTKAIYFHTSDSSSISMYTGDGDVGTTGADGGLIQIVTGDGGSGTTGAGGSGGKLLIGAGNGGVRSGSTSPAGIGGDVSILAGDGGENTNDGIGIEGGPGGNIHLIAGLGGTANGGTADGGDGGDIILFAGAGGSSTDQSGNGGDVFIYGGHDDAGSYTSTNAGDIYIGSNTTGTDRGQVFFSDGAEGRPSISFGGDKDTGFFLPSGGKVGLSIGSSQLLSMSFGTDASVSNALILNSDDSLLIKPDDSTSSSGDVMVQAGLNAGNLYLYGGTRSGVGTGGNIYMFSGDPEVGGYDTGRIFISTAQNVAAATNQTGDIILQTAGTGLSAGGIYLDVADASGGSDGEVFIQGLATSGGDSYLTLNNSSGGKVYRFAPGPSDERLKNVLYSVENVVDKISNINSFYYNWNEFALDNVFTGMEDYENKISIGISAQELEKVFPVLVSDFVGDDNIKYKKIDYQKLNVITIQAIKEQQEEIKELKKVVKEQQKNIDKLLKINNLK